MIDTLFMIIKLQTLPRCTTPFSQQHAGGAETTKMNSCFWMTVKYPESRWGRNSRWLLLICQPNCAFL